MKRNSILICLIFAVTANTFTIAKAQVNTTDSLALVDLYNSTNGPNWIDHTNWLTTKPVSTWYGITVTGSRVVRISIILNGLNGTLPASIGNLTALTYLNLVNSYLSGAIPSTIGNLTNLTYLDLSVDGFTGAIPATIGNLTSLDTLSLIENKLTGAIPPEIGNLTNLTDLDLRYNQLSGNIPVEVGNLTKLSYLSLYNNQLSGTIPAEIGNLTKLTYLSLYNNQLSGAIPASLGNLTNLNYLILNYNQLSGAIPASLGNLTNLNYLSLIFNQLSGAIPASLGNLPKIRHLYLNNNQLTGTIPSALGKLTKLYRLYLNNNQLSGAVPYTLNKLLDGATINLSFNRLSQFEGGHYYMDTNYRVSLDIHKNLFTFDGIEDIAKYSASVKYAPQDTVLPIHKYGNTLMVKAGGTVSNNTYTWYLVGTTNSTTIQGNSTFTPSTSGKYYVYVTNSVAAKLTLHSKTISYTMPLQSNATFLAENTAGIKSADNKLQVYPNPAKNIIHVQVKGNAIIILTNSAGKIIFSKNINNDSEINVSGYANGVYYLQNKTTGETQKVVVVH